MPGHQPRSEVVLQLLKNSLKQSDSCRSPSASNYVEVIGFGVVGEMRHEFIEP